MFLGHGGKDNSLNGYKSEENDRKNENESKLNGDKSEEEEQSGRGQHPVFNFAFPGTVNDDSRHFKDRALNLALQFNGERTNGGRVRTTTSTSTSTSPKSEEIDERRNSSPNLLVSSSDPAEGGNPATMVASVQAALAALQAGQISLNQVRFSSCSLHMLNIINYVLLLK